MIYLDNAASTAIHPDVLTSMMPYLSQWFGNPSSIHRQGRMARKAIKNARMNIASLINASPSEILITSGGTESNNTALKSVAAQQPSSHIITSSIEHDAILEPCRALSNQGFDVEYIPVDKFGRVSIDDLQSKITDRTCLVSVMFGNNEVGTIQPISEIAKICQNHNILFHTDAVQAVGKMPIDVKDIGVDLMSISSHKLYGPKGVGALYVRKGTKIDPMILGGGQEGGLRSGTENVAGIVGFGKACEIARICMRQNTAHLQSMHNKLIEGVLGSISATTLNGDPVSRLINNIHFTFLGVNGEDLIIKLDEYGVAASTGSACSVNTQKASHVLEAMAFSSEQISGSLRLSTGMFNTEDEIIRVTQILKDVVSELRAVSPFKEKYSFID